MSQKADILVRAAEPGDVPQLTELNNQPRAYWGTLQTPFTSVAAREKRFAGRGDNELMLVAVFDGKVVGSAGMVRETRHRRAHTAGIGMAVHDDHAGRGVGTALMRAMVDVADRWWNIKRLELDVYVDNVRAIALYERFGFEREGVLRAYAWRDGQYVDTIAMARLRL
jgi:putative acetyltransferase